MVALADRMKAIKGQQAANLAYAKERETAAAMPQGAPKPVQRPARQKAAMEKPSPVIAVAPPFVDPTLEENIAFFNALYPAIMDLWQCDAGERAHIKKEWTKPEIVGHIVRDWMKQAVTHNLVVPEELTRVAYQIFHVDVMLPHLAERQIRITTGELEENPVTSAREAAAEPPAEPTQAVLTVTLVHPQGPIVALPVAAPGVGATAPVGSAAIEVPPARKRRFGR